MSGLLEAMLSLAGGLAGGYCGSYMSKKGENLATREDVRAITKEVEAAKEEFSNRLEMLRQSLALDRERFSHDYGLFAQRRIDAYAQIYGLYEQAFGLSDEALGGTFELFEESDADDVRQFFLDDDKRTLFSMTERAEVDRALANDIGEGRLAGRKLAFVGYRRKAMEVIHELNNAIVLQALYVSPELEALFRRNGSHLDVVRRGLGGWEHYVTEQKASVQTALLLTRGTGDEIRARMREELRGSFGASKEKE